MSEFPHESGDHDFQFIGGDNLERAWPPLEIVSRIAVEPVTLPDRGDELIVASRERRAVFSSQPETTEPAAEPVAEADESRLPEAEQRDLRTQLDRFVTAGERPFPAAAWYHRELPREVASAHGFDYQVDVYTEDTDHGPYTIAAIASRVVRGQMDVPAEGSEGGWFGEDFETKEVDVLEEHHVDVEAELYDGDDGTPLNYGVESKSTSPYFGDSMVGEQPGYGSLTGEIPPLRAQDLRNLIRALRQVNDGPAVRPEEGTA